MSEPRFQKGSIPQVAYHALAGGARMNVREISKAIHEHFPNHDGWNIYSNVAQAMTTFAKAGRVAREKVRGRFVYWRTDVEKPSTAAAS